MLVSPLTAAVEYLGAKTISMSDTDMGQPFGWKWHTDEGARFALIGTYQELHEMALDILARRHANGNAPTTTQQALALHHAGFRDLQALLLDVTDELYDRQPKVGEWSLRHVLGHIIGVARTFFTLTDYGLRRAKAHDDSLPAEHPTDEGDRLFEPFAEFEALTEQGTFAEVMAYATRLHQRTLTTFGALTDADLAIGTMFWEGEALSVRHRLLRFPAHNRQHTIQAEKTFDWLGASPHEAKRLLRQVYMALAAVESAILGATETDADLPAQEALATLIRDRADAVADVVADTHTLITAIQKRDKTHVEELLAQNPTLSEAITPAGISVIMLALYYGGREIADVLAAKKPWWSLQEAAALGNVEKVESCIEAWAEWVHEITPDGYTALQLACFFGNSDAAKVLVAAGSDINAISQNSMATTPLHAATAGNHTELARYLVEQGADLQHMQNGGFTVLHSAAQNGNVELVTLFLAKGVDPAAKTDAGQSARDFAEEEGNAAVLALF